MESLPSDLFTLSVLVFVLGLKHGLDADHLATIDGLTRFNARTNPRLARFCGILFSSGHGTVVIVIALTVSTLADQWQTPRWLEAFGAWISIGFLVTLGILNALAVMQAQPTQIVQPVGIKGCLFGRFVRVTSPGLVALVGVLFALSFDTMSQAVIFALTATQFGGWQSALVLGLIFTLGMIITDGINGLWISRLIRRSDQIALIASRVMSLVVAGVSLLVAAFGVAKLISPAVEIWSEGKELFLGAGVVAIIALSFLMAVWRTRATLPASISG